MYLLNVCTSIHAVRFTNLGVLTINALKVSKCFTFLFAAVPMCFHAAMFHMAVSFTCFFFVTFLNFLSRVHLMYLQGGGGHAGPPITGIPFVNLLNSGLPNQENEKYR